MACSLMRFFLFLPEALDYECRDYETFTHVDVLREWGRRWDAGTGRGGDGGVMGDAERTPHPLCFPLSIPALIPSLFLSHLSLVLSPESHLSLLGLLSSCILFIKVVGKDVHSISSLIGRFVGWDLKRQEH